MQIDITNRPGNSAARVSLDAGETITAEGGAMIAMSGNVSVETTTQKRDSGSILGALKRMMTGESFFLNHFTPSGEGGEVYFGTVMAGDMMEYQLDGPGLLVQGRAELPATAAAAAAAGLPAVERGDCPPGSSSLGAGGKNGRPVDSKNRRTTPPPTACLFLRASVSRRASSSAGGYTRWSE